MATQEDSSNQMFAKDRFDAAIRIADTAYRSFQDRRAIEWKVSFGGWVALGVLTYTVLHIDPELREHGGFRIGAAVLVIGLTVIFELFHRRAQMSHWRDVMFYRHFKRHAERLAKGEPPNAPPEFEYPLDDDGLWKGPNPP